MLMGATVKARKEDGERSAEGIIFPAKGSGPLALGGALAVCVLKRIGGKRVRLGEESGSDGKGKSAGPKELVYVGHKARVSPRVVVFPAFPAR